jgi:hypothetical protein
MKNNNSTLYTVYKVVTDIDGKYVSSDVRGDAMFTYTIGEQTKSKTPIFVFDKVKRARQYSVRSPILVGTSTTKPTPTEKLTSKLLAPYEFDLTKETVKEFWHYIARDGMPPKHLRRLITIADESYIVYDFTPLEVLL